MTTYEELINNANDDLNHLKALIFARGVKPSDEVDEAFFDVLEEEGYQVEGYQVAA